MNELTRILMAAAKKRNAENDIKLKKIAEVGDDKLGAGVYYDKDFSEYRVILVRDGADQTEADYHTGCEQDARDTAALMIRPAGGVSCGECNDTGTVPEGDKCFCQPVTLPSTVPVEPLRESGEFGRVQRKRSRGYRAKPSGLLHAMLARHEVVSYPDPITQDYLRTGKLPGE